MKKYYLILVLAFFCLFPLTNFAQKGKSDIMLQVEGCAFGDMKPEERAIVGNFYITNRLYVGTRLTDATLLMKQDDKREYFKTRSYGLNVGYRVIKDDLFNLITEAGYSLSLKSSDWRYNTCHLMCYIEIEHHKMFFRFGIGGKHYDTRGSAHKNYLKPIASLGFGIRI